MPNIFIMPMVSMEECRNYIGSDLQIKIGKRERKRHDPWLFYDGQNDRKAQLHNILVVSYFMMA
jgi:hypothetical protein